MIEPSLVIRADAGPDIGAGHLMRCLALAQAWPGPVIFACHRLPGALRGRLVAAGMRVAEVGLAAASLVTLLDSLEPAAVVLDGYRFDDTYLAQIQRPGARLLLLDDTGQYARFDAGLVLNQNLHAQVATYANRRLDTRLLLGVRYTLLRREFMPWLSAMPERPLGGRRLLVTLGGGDPYRLTERVVEALTPLAVAVTVVAGGGYPAFESLAAQTAAAGFALRRSVSDMAAVLADSDMAITAAGSTVWEAMFMGVPALVIPYADNQRPIASFGAQTGAVESLGWGPDLGVEAIREATAELLDDGARRQRMRVAGRQVIDGRGAARVVGALLDPPLLSRLATLADAPQLWKWVDSAAPEVVSFPTPSQTLRRPAWTPASLEETARRVCLTSNESGALTGLVSFWRAADGATVEMSAHVAQQTSEALRKVLHAGTATLFLEEPELKWVDLWVGADAAAVAQGAEESGFLRAECGDGGGHTLARFRLDRPGPEARPCRA